MMSLKVEIQNIGGLQGTHSFTFNKGLNVLKAPNATGKTSLLNAIFLVVANEQIERSELEEYLTDNEVAGYVKLTDDEGNKSEIRLTRDISKGVLLTKADISPEIHSELAYLLVFLRDKSKINQGIQTANDIMIENWFLDITKVNIFHSVWATTQDIFQQIENSVETLKEKQQDDIEPIENLIEERRTILENKNKRRQEIINDPINQKNQRRIKELTKEINSLNNQIRNSKNNLSNLENKEEPALKKESLELKSEIDRLSEELKNIEAKREELMIEKKKWANKIKLSKTESEILRNELKEIREKKKDIVTVINRLNKLKDRSICPLCDSDIDKQKNKEDMKRQEKELEDLIDKEVKAEAKLGITKNELKIAQNRIKEIEQEIKYSPEALQNEIDTKSKKFKGIDKAIQVIRKDILKIKEDIKTLENTNKKKENELNECLNPEVQKENEELNKLVSDLQVELNRLEIRREKYLEDNKELAKMEKKLLVAEKIAFYYRNRVEIIRKEMVKTINDNLENSFKLLKLAELERITLDPDHFKLDIQRIDKTYTSLEKMSGAERALISVIISYIVKSTLLPENPILLIDEVTSEMDETRFKDIINLISKKVPYLIVSRHTPFMGEKTLISIEDIANSL